MASAKRFDQELRSLSAILRRKQAAYKSDAGVSGTDMQIIAYLFDREKQNTYQRDVEREFALRRSTVSGILKDMEARGLILRAGVASDARLKKVMPTDKASSLYQYYKNDMESYFEKLTDGLTDTQVDDFCTIVRQMRKNADKNR